MKKLRALKNEFFNALRVGWFLAVRQIRRSSKGTTGLIIFIMVLTFLNLVVVSGLLVGLISGSFKQFRESYSGEVIITASPGRDYIENSQELLHFLESHPKVRALTARHTLGMAVLGTLTDLPAKNERPNRMAAQIVGIDPDKEEAVTKFSRFLMSGENLDPSEEGGILIGANLLRKYSSFADANIPGLDLLQDVDVGQHIRVSTTRKDGTVVSRDLIVKGIVKSKVDQISTRLFMLDQDLKRMMPIHQEEYQEIAIKTDAKYQHIPVIVLSAFVHGGEGGNIEIPADAYIPKSLDGDEMIDKINELLNMKAK